MGETAVYLASQNNNDDLTKYLIQTSSVSTINQIAQSSNYPTVLMNACKQGSRLNYPVLISKTLARTVIHVSYGLDELSFTRWIYCFAYCC